MRVLLVDLNNFSMYPTISIGILASLLRRVGIDVEVLSPLAHGVPGVVREAPPRPWGRLAQAAGYWSATTPLPAARALRERAASHRSRRRRDLSRILAREIGSRVDAGAVDAVLVSSYLQYFDEVAEIGALCARRATPLILGGSYLNQPAVARKWLSLPGLSALVAGEVEPELADIVRSVVENRDLGGFAGVWTRTTVGLRPAPPLVDLDAVPFPDYSDFPWHRYPSRIVPILASRGCGWGVCTFCSDVTSATGRTFRARSAANVLDELDFQARKLGARQFVFTDLKLNSDLALWRTLLGSIPSRVPGASWIGAVHVGSRGDNGLSKDDLMLARESGMVRLTTGLESGSQAVLDLMAKGTSIERSSQFLHDACGAGISVRVTLMVGYPGERADDVRQTAAFLRAHAGEIERATLNRFQIMIGTTIERRITSARGGSFGLADLRDDPRNAQMHHRALVAAKREHRSAVFELIAAVDAINRRPLRGAASAFEGVM